MPSLTAMFPKKTVTLLPLLAATLALAGCEDFRGVPSERPPIHPVLDMDFQPKVRAQSELEFDGWKDHRGARRPDARRRDPRLTAHGARRRDLGSRTLRGRTLAVRDKDVVHTRASSRLKGVTLPMPR